MPEQSPPTHFFYDSVSKETVYKNLHPIVFLRDFVFEYANDKENSHKDI